MWHHRQDLKINLKQNARLCTANTKQNECYHSSDPQTTFSYINDAYKICICPDYQVAISENCLKTVDCVVSRMQVLYEVYTLLSVLKHMMVRRENVTWIISREYPWRFNCRRYYCNKEDDPFVIIVIYNAKSVIVSDHGNFSHLLTKI